MKERLFWRLRDGMFSMDAKGNGFPTPIAERVMRYSPMGLKLYYPNFLAYLVKYLGGVVGYNFDIDDCYTAVENELGCGKIITRGSEL